MPSLRHGRISDISIASTVVPVWLGLWSKRSRSDVVVAHLFFNLPVIVACLAAHWYRKPLIVTPHGCLDDFDTRNIKG